MGLILKLICDIYGNEYEDRIFLKGPMPDLSHEFSNAGIFCLSSDYEGFPLSALEAAACGIPVIMPDVGGAFEIEQSGSGLIYSPNRAKALAHHIIALSDNKEALLLMNKCGLQSGREIFSYNIFIEKMRKIYGAI